MAMISTFRASGPASPASTNSRNSRSGSRSAAPRVSKGTDAYDLSSLSDSLPPNTGPPGVTAITNGAGTANSNKNLSHVPCKFFKQGICQAGKSCPFSHNVDGTSSADKLPCKYFQKGNCKFGSKCALAHILPDGTRVNSKSVSNYRRNNERYERTQIHSNGSPQGASTHNFLGHTRSPSGRNHERLADPFYVANEESGFNSPSSFISPSTTAFLRESQYFNSEGFGSGQEISVGYGNEWSYNYSSTVSHNDSGTFGTGIVPSATLSSSPVLLVNNSVRESRPSAFDFSSPRNTPHQKTPSKLLLSLSTSPLLNYNEKQEDCAVLDDEKESSSEDTYYEDYIPASLGNLIFTPQEKQRRDSRSQSGTLLVRPDIFSDSSAERKSALPTFLDGEWKATGEVFLMD